MSTLPAAERANPELVAPRSSYRSRWWSSARARVLWLAFALAFVIATWKIYPLHRAKLVLLTIGRSQASIPQGLGMQYWVAGRFSNGADRDLTEAVTWISSNPSVLSIDQSGLATARKMGKATIEAASGSLHANLDVEITAPELIALAITPSRLSAVQGSSIHYSVTGTISDGRREELTARSNWSSSDPNVVKIDPHGAGYALSPGSTIIRVVSGSVATEAALTVTSAANGFPGIYASRNDPERTAQNRNETALTLANVNVSSFGKVFTDPVDGFVYPQPLYVPKLAIPKRGTHDVVYVATSNNSVYAFDANAKGEPLWRTNLGSAVPRWAQPCNDIRSSIGILSTPAIDPRTKTIYLVSRTFQDKTNYYSLHALDLATGAEKFGGPVGISAEVRGSGSGGRLGHITFDPSLQLQRPGLVLANGKIYIGFGSECDVGHFHGWLMAYDAATLAQLSVFITTPNGQHGGVWQSGAAPAVDLSDNLYAVTGDGSFDANSGGLNYGDTVMKLPGADERIVPADFFAPFNAGSFFKENADLGAGGPILLPDQKGIHSHLLLLVSKDGTIYLLDRDNLGRFKSSGNSQIVQTVSHQFATFIHGTSAFWQSSSQGWIYVSAANDRLKAFSIRDGVLSTSPASETSNTFAYPGASPSVSSSGNLNGILWAISTGKQYTAVLNAYDASNVARRLYSSDEAPNGRDQADKFVKFVVPTVANGKVYFGAQKGLEVYGLLDSNSARANSAAN